MKALKIRPVFYLILLIFVQTTTVCASSFTERRNYILDYYSKTYPNAQFWGDDDIKTAMGFVLARLETKRDVKQALDMLDRMQDIPFEMFDRHQNIDAYLRFSSVYPEALKKKVRKTMTDTDYLEDGSTENHKLMFKTAGYLTALAFPDWEKSAHTKDHCRSELIKMMESFVKYGQREYDSSTYGTFYITCLLSLYDHTPDPDLKNRVQMTLEWCLLNFAPEWLNGYFIASTLREYEFACSPKMEISYPLLGWLYFGGGPNPSLEQHYKNGNIVINNEGFFVVLATISSYKLPVIIEKIALERKNAYVHKESHDMDPFCQLNYPWGFKKYTYINKHYGLTSQWDGLSLGWSGQMRRWKLVWESDAPASTFFVTHPCYYEGAAEHLRGATPREQVLQHNGTLLAMYKIESAEPHPYITGVVPVDAIKQIKEDKSGWIFFDGGSILFAVKFFHPYQWVEDRYFRTVKHKMLQCDERGTAMVLETCLPEEYNPSGSKTALDLFAENILNKTKLEYIHKTVEYREATYHSLKGDTLRIVYNYGRYINGEKVDYNQWPLISDPWMYQSVEGRFLNVTDGQNFRVYDFLNWKINAN
ncbi:MAG: hypothetical protein LBU57_00235 [Dysgonamonadaceae bacterium]|jgi:hypothetical protein|nr:hypothetical protein [Dysgonamonadaceae bacterium]